MLTRTFAPNNLDLTGRSILITGGTGSFGQKFIKQLLADYQPRRVIVFSRDELKQFEMQQVFSPGQYPCMRYFLGDVRDYDRLLMAFRGVDYIIHAAALKQVPAAEYNPGECIKTNVYGAENVVRAAIANNVEKVVALSTDKAAGPVNLYGASKLASDKIFIAGNNVSGAGGTAFSVVRYGNVAGSRGSVIPFFKRLLKNGADYLPITDNRMTRFWITLPQGVNFVLSSLATMQRGELFVPKIPSFKVTDIARLMAPDLPQKEIGIRPGEKLHEIMVPFDENPFTIELEDRYIIQPQLPFWTQCQDAYQHATPVSNTFAYASDTNSEWLSDEAFMDILGDTTHNEAA